MPLPKKWQRFFIGRKVTHPNRSEVEGVIKYASSIRLGQKDPQGFSGEAITTSFCVEWSDGTSGVMEDTEVAKIATDEFVKEDWVLDRILKLQECGWNEAKADAAMTAAALTRPASAAGGKSKGKASAKSKSGAGASTKAGPSTNAVCISLQDLKRKVNSPDGVSQKLQKKPRKLDNLPLSPSQVANKEKHKQQQQQAPEDALKENPKTKGKPTSKALDDNSANDGAIVGPSNGAAVTRGGAATATSPRKVIFPASPRGGRTKGPASTRILSPLLHVNSLSYAKIRGKIVFQYDEVDADGIKYRVYNKDLIIESSLCFKAVAAGGKPADMTIDTWKIRGKYEKSEEYLLDCIVAQRLTSKAVERNARKGKNNNKSPGKSTVPMSDYEFLLKYTKFELDPGPDSWLPYSDVEQTAAYDKWHKKGRMEWTKGIIAVKTAAGLES